MVKNHQTFLIYYSYNGLKNHQIIRKREMNIIHIINTLEIGGAERLLVATLPEIKQMKHDVKVILLYS